MACASLEMKSEKRIILKQRIRNISPYRHICPKIYLKGDQMMGKPHIRYYYYFFMDESKEWSPKYFLKDIYKYTEKFCREEYKNDEENQHKYNKRGAKLRDAFRDVDKHFLNKRMGYFRDTCINFGYLIKKGRISEYTCKFLLALILQKNNFFFTIDFMEDIEKWIQEGKTIDEKRTDVDLFDHKYRYTELGLKDRFIDYVDGELFFVPEINKWLYWNEKKWEIDFSETEVNQRGISMVEEMRHQLAFFLRVDDNARDYTEGQEFVTNIEKISRIKGFINAARSSNLRKKITAFDTKEHLFNLENGTYDFSKNKFKTLHDKEDFLMKIASAQYKENAHSEKWDDFIQFIFSEDDRFIEYVQKAVGYSLTESTSEQCLFILYGEGQNGKTVFLNVISKMLGDYSANTPIETLLAKKAKNTVSNDLARLKDIRFVTASESDRQDFFSEARIKALTGGDTITARYLRKENFEYTPKFKIWIATNYRPVIRSTDLSIWRRIKVIPFNNVVKKINRNLEKELLEEKSGILNWAIEGYKKWASQGLGDVPEVMSLAIDEYKLEADIVGRFLNDKCRETNEGRVPKGELYKEYEKWTRENGEFKETQKMLGRILNKRGYVEQKSGGTRYWKGIEIIKEH